MPQLARGEAAERIAIKPSHCRSLWCHAMPCHVMPCHALVATPLVWVALALQVLGLSSTVSHDLLQWWFSACPVQVSPCLSVPALHRLGPGTLCCTMTKAGLWRFLLQRAITSKHVTCMRWKCVGSVWPVCCCLLHLCVFVLSILAGSTAAAADAASLCARALCSRTPCGHAVFHQRGVSSSPAKPWRCHATATGSLTSRRLQHHHQCLSSIFGDTLFCRCAFPRAQSVKWPISHHVHVLLVFYAKV